MVEQPVGEAAAWCLRALSTSARQWLAVPRCLKTRLLGRRWRPAGETTQRHTLAPGRPAGAQWRARRAPARRL